MIERMTADEPPQKPPVKRSRRSRRVPIPQQSPPGTPPGALRTAISLEQSEVGAIPVRVRLMAYGSQAREALRRAEVREDVDLPEFASGDDVIEERELTLQDVGKIEEIVSRHAVTWISVEGLGDGAIVTELGRIFDLHRLALEDVITPNQRAKVESFPKHLFFLGQTPQLTEGNLRLVQVAVFIGERYVLSFHHLPTEGLDRVRDRVRKGRGRIRTGGPDYLAYALLDTTTDSFFPVLEHHGEALETLEEQMAAQTSGADTMRSIHEIKRDLLLLRKAVWPLREALGSVFHLETPLIASSTRVFLRDCYDHSVQIIDLVETYRELTSSLMEVYLSTISNRMNEIMKVLTIISTIFIPLNFIVGVYGMNFDTQLSPWNMPELKWYWGYPFVLAVIALVGFSLLYYFYRKGWIGMGRNQ